ncbi:DEAD/DEAH box helicase [Variovorax guangxiensis]|uniref:DNA 3'-5' helicase n=1 Tax=Variovorax guangxiensis TaxID=1775474 RepID=A0A3S0XDU6_9BURK|nr:protein DpdF [Variovorax guangxiensis]RUR67534.1 DEAD/DEAH box helicase [Variovorax guangxiensis]
MNFGILQEVLAAWPTRRHEIKTNPGGLFARIAGVLSTSPIGADLQPLLRHALMRESARRHQSVALRVPLFDDWPTPESYPHNGLRIVRRGHDHLVIEAKNWRPAWLNHNGDEDLFTDSFSERSSRLAMTCAIDPAVQEATGFDTYSTAGQRAAVHAVLLAPPRATLVVTLPTGSGKSLVAQAPSLMTGEGACTIVVVPTVSLAMDQARQFKHLWRRRHPDSDTSDFAWHYNSPASTKQKIKQALRTGRQPILFTSPESVVGTLRMALYDAAQRGYLKYLVVDEAHLVAQWGDSFRPEFQSLAAFRRALLAAAPDDGFKTVLMTATLTAEALATIETMFTDGKPAELIASVHLRTEPRYWYYRAEDDANQRSRVLEVLRNAPRPLILYVTEVEKAKQWTRWLKADGYSRVASFHGETGNQERQRLIDQWAADEVDIMVATAAFGVGIDKRDVRCVVHACVPESLDRYYQEVGRGGRDGCASSAIVIFTKGDLDTAHGIAIPALISAELGRPRWQQMLQHGVAITGHNNVWRVDISTVAPNLHRTSDYNRAWNLRTLLLLARAGVIELANEKPAIDGGDGATDELDEEQLRAIFDSVLVRILRSDHLDEELWSTFLEQKREETIAAAQAGLDRIERVLKGQTEISRELQSMYTIATGDGRRVTVAAACAGCPKCRNAGLTGPDIAVLFSRPLVLPLYANEATALTRWRQRMPAWHRSPVYVLFDPSDLTLERRLAQLALGLRDFGLRELHLQRSDWPGAPEWSVIREAGTGRFVALTDLGDSDNELAQLPRLTVIRQWDPQVFMRLEQESARPFDWILLPSDATEPSHPQRRFADARECLWLPALLDTIQTWVS